MLFGLINDLHRLETEAHLRPFKSPVALADQPGQPQPVQCEVRGVRKNAVSRQRELLLATKTQFRVRHGAWYKTHQPFGELGTQPGTSLFIYLRRLGRFHTAGQRPLGHGRRVPAPPLVRKSHMRHRVCKLRTGAGVRLACCKRRGVTRQLDVLARVASCVSPGCVRAPRRGAVGTPTRDPCAPARGQMCSAWETARPCR